MLEQVQEKLKNYMINNPDKRAYIAGIDKTTGKIKLENVEDKKLAAIVTIDDLENNRFDFQNFKFVDNVTLTLNDVKTLVDLNKKDELDKILKTFAADENGMINLNKAISTVTLNTVNEAVNCTIKGKDFTTELYKYDVTGKLISDDSVSNFKPSKDDIINKSFNNILVYTGVARIEGVNYSEEQIEKAKVSYSTMVNNKLNSMGYVENVVQSPVKEEVVPEMPVEEDIKPDNAIPVNEKAKAKQLTKKPDLQKAGFADVFILTIIVLVYAVIIINLVLKLK